MPATTPRPRSPAPTEAARRNALKQGLAALHDFVLEDEAPSELEELTARLMTEVEPETEIEARLVKRMAIAFWKSERAERIEVALFDAAPKLRPPQAGFEWEEADPLTTFDLKRFNAIRGYQAQQGRELSRCLKELRQLRREALKECVSRDRPDARSDEPPHDTPEPEPAESRAQGVSDACLPCTFEPEICEPRNTTGQTDRAVRTSEPEPPPALNRHQRRRLEALARKRLAA